MQTLEMTTAGGPEERWTVSWLTGRIDLLKDFKGPCELAEPSWIPFNIQEYFKAWLGMGGCYSPMANHLV